MAVILTLLKFVLPHIGDTFVMEAGSFTSCSDLQFSNAVIVDGECPGYGNYGSTDLAQHRQQAR